jgi:hypothetical protein
VKAGLAEGAGARSPIEWQLYLYAVAATSRTSHRTTDALAVGLDPGPEPLGHPMGVLLGVPHGEWQAPAIGTPVSQVPDWKPGSVVIAGTICSRSALIACSRIHSGNVNFDQHRVHLNSSRVGGFVPAGIMAAIGASSSKARIPRIPRLS